MSRRAALLLLSLAACDFRFSDETRAGPSGLSSFRVEVLGESGTAELPIPVPRGMSTVRVRATAIAYDGEPLKSYRGSARVKVTPGRTVPLAYELRFEDATPTDGMAEVEVNVLGVHSATQVWVIDDDPSESDPPTFSVGMGGPIWFDEPTLADVNQIPPNGDNTGSAYPGDFVEMSRTEDPVTGAVKRDLIVTAIFNDGFFVSDLAEPPHPTYLGNFASLFAYNFSYPDDLVVGDRLERLQGTLLDFSGNTQLGFPSWVRDEGGPYLGELAALEAAAPAITATACGTAATSLELCGYSSSNFDLESLESAVTMIPRVRLPELWVRCDLNGDGDVAPFRAAGSSFVCDPGDLECECNAACLTSQSWTAPGWEDRAFDATGLVCSELGNYQTYGQYAVRLLTGDEAGPRINIQSRDSIPDFDPLAESSLGTVVSVRGVLRHVRAARPRWLLLTRTAHDMCCLEPACPAGLAPCGG